MEINLIIVLLLLSFTLGAVLSYIIWQKVQKKKERANNC